MLDFFFGRKKAKSSGLPDFDSLAKTTHFTLKELYLLYERFNHIKNDNNIVTIAAFSSQPELLSNKLINRAFVYESLNVSQMGITYEIFVKILSHFSFKASKQEKFDCNIIIINIIKIYYLPNYILYL